VKLAQTAVAGSAAAAPRLARTLAVAHQKGGVGKTTTTAALGAALADLGERVIIVDADPQGSLSDSLGYAPETLTATLADLLQAYLESGRAIDPRPCLRRLSENLSILPTNDDRLALCEIQLASHPRRALAFSDALVGLRSLAEWILIDCPPSQSPLTVSALTFADQLVIPISPEPMVIARLQMFMRTVWGVRQEGLNPDLSIAGIILTRSSPGTTLTRLITGQLREFFDGSVPVLGEVRASIKVQEAAGHHVPVTWYEPAAAAGQEYRRIAEVLRNARERI